MDKIKTRFAPSPTGYLHVGGARTALFSYLIARQAGGTFLLRIEDTDRARHEEAAVAKIIDDLRWLGIEWDEGVDLDASGEVTEKGPAGPYRQSERLEIYKTHIEKLLAESKAYFAFDTPAQLDQMRKAAEAAKKSFIYPRPDALPTEADADRATEQGLPVVVRFLSSKTDVTINDEAFGEVTVPGTEMDDFIIRKADGYPTYHLANVVDDALMGVNFVVRGQEFLGQTWRHVQLREAFGFAGPRYCHLPLIMDNSGRKLSKRHGDVDVHAFRAAGYLPEALVNFIALLGWRPGGDREKLTLAELIELFSSERIGKSNAKFDRDKLLAFNKDATAQAGPERLLAGFKDYLSLNETPIPADDDELLAQLLQINKGFRTFADIVNKSGVLFAEDNSYDFDEKSVKKILVKNDRAGYQVLADLAPILSELDWEAGALEGVIHDYCENNGLGMGKVAQPLRVAVTGTTISPPIYETLVILGRDKTLARIARCLLAK